MISLRSGDPTKLGQYQILARVGAGAMGAVFLGVDLNGTLRAIKVISRENRQDATYRARFKQEITTLRGLKGDYIAHIRDFNTQTEPWWYASEFIPGATLQEVVTKAGGKLPTDQVLILAYNLLRALDSFHKFGVVHRDLKPANIMLSNTGVKVIDFGIAKGVRDPNITSSGVVIGTVTYMSPEQLRGEKLNPASDIFALGSIITYAATGREPFAKAGMAGALVASNILRGQPDLSGLPSTFQEFVKACLIKNPARRPTIAQLRAMLPGSPTAKNTFGPGIQRTVNANIAAYTTQTALFQKQRQAPKSRTPQRRQHPGPAEIRRAARKKVESQPSPLKVLLIASAALAMLASIGVVAYSQISSALARGDEAHSTKHLPPTPRLTVGKFGTTSDEGLPGTHLKVTDAKLSGYTLTVSVKMSGYKSPNETSPLRRTCIRFEHRYYYYPNEVRLENGIGEITFTVLSAGKLELTPECERTKGVRSATVGTISLALKGVASVDRDIVSVMASRVEGGNLIVTIPRYADTDPARMCVKRGKIAVRPTNTTKVVNANVGFNELTFKGATSGVFYMSCDTSNAKQPKFHGRGVKLT